MKRDPAGPRAGGRDVGQETGRGTRTVLVSGPDRVASASGVFPARSTGVGGGRAAGHETGRGGFRVDTGGCRFPASPDTRVWDGAAPRDPGRGRLRPPLVARTLLTLCPLGLCGSVPGALCAGFSVGPRSPAGRAWASRRPGAWVRPRCLLFWGENTFSEAFVEGGKRGPVARGCWSGRDPSCGRPVRGPRGPGRPLGSGPRAFQAFGAGSGGRAPAWTGRSRQTLGGLQTRERTSVR